jgi:DNA-binding transcriptional LysR family regulator
MDWNDLRYFLAVARCGGLTPAAALLGASPATVSRRINACEQALGLTLFLRRQSGYLLTDDGEQVLASALPVEQAMLGFERARDSSGGAGQWRGSVRVATTEMLATHLIAPQLAQFTAQYPGLQVELLTGLGQANLSRRDADIALRLMAPNKDDEGDYIAQPLGALRFAPYIAAHLAGREHWRTLPHIDWDESHRHFPMATWSAATFGASPPIVSSNSMHVQHMAVRQGLGVGVLPMYVGEHDARLVRIEPDTPIPARELWLMVHRDLRGSERVGAMRAFLARICGAMTAQRYAGESSPANTSLAANKALSAAGKPA